MSVPATTPEQEAILALHEVCEQQRELIAAQARIITAYGLRLDRLEAANRNQRRTGVLK